MRQKKKVHKPRKKRVPGAPKKPRAPKVPKTRCSGTMTEAAYWSFIRSALRQKSRRWKPVYDCLAAARRPSKNPNKRLKWEFQCNECKGWFPGAQVSVDHVEPVGSLRCGGDLDGFVSRLFCEIDSLQVLCDTDHQKKTNEERAA